jgi:hypothetical protein
MQSVTKGQCSPSIHAVKAELLFALYIYLMPFNLHSDGSRARQVSLIRRQYATT